MNQLALEQKPLPLPVQDQFIPPSSSQITPPTPPQKPYEVHSRPPLSSVDGTIDSSSTLPLTPTTPLTPSNSSFPSSDTTKTRKPNPLNDLIDTEKIYVDQLTGIIRKVAAAWSRSNLPPPQLDTMFRSIEAIYKANRAFHSKLKDIGSNPSSPKALGDLLMRWIDDLHGPYTAYCTRYQCGFDTWDPVQSNAKLESILVTFSSTSPPTPTLTVSPTTLPTIWTLDDLFLLPKTRLKYYKKLYGRLLKSTAPGKSDHKLLVGALETLDRLLETLESRSSIKVGESAPFDSPPVSMQEPEEEVVIDLRTQSVIQQHSRQDGDTRRSADTTPGSESSSARGSSLSGGERLSRETATTSVSRVSSATLSMPISDLERRLSTQRTLDVFTMQPKLVRLQMAPPSLTFTRELKLSADVVMRFTSSVTGVESLHTLGHIYILSDLFLICDRMTTEERTKQDVDGPDMWLSYPPLAGKVLRVFELSEQPNVFKVVIMRKETLILEAESAPARDFMMSKFRECIEFSQSLPPPSRLPPPPVPPLNGLPRSPHGSIPSATPSPPATRSSSPPRVQPRESIDNVISHPHSPLYQSVERGAAESMSKLVLSPDIQIQQGAQRAPPTLDSSSGPMYRAPSVHPQINGMPNDLIPPFSQQGPHSFRTSISSQRGPFRPGSAPGLGEHTAPSPFTPRGPVLGPAGYPINPSTGPPGPFPPPQQPPYLNPQMAPNRPILQDPRGTILPNVYPPRPPSEPGFHGDLPGGIRKTTSTHSLASQYSHHERNPAPPIPGFPGGHHPNHTYLPRSSSHTSLPGVQSRPLLPSMQPASRSVSIAGPSFDEPSPPGSPVEETPKFQGPVTSAITADMKCKVFLQQQHAQWKALGAARLRLYCQQPTNIKQLVVEANNKEKSMLISTIVLTDGVERVGKTGVAIELSDRGARTGIIYMLQLRNEKSAGGFFDSLLQGSDRMTKS